MINSSCFILSNMIQKRCAMFDELNPVESLVKEIKGNAGFLEKLIFPNAKFVVGFFFFGVLIAVVFFMS